MYSHWPWAFTPGLPRLQLFLSILVHRPILPRLSSANQGYASDVEIKIADAAVAKTRAIFLANPRRLKFHVNPRVFVQEPFKSPSRLVSSFRGLSSCNFRFRVNVKGGERKNALSITKHATRAHEQSRCRFRARDVPRAKTMSNSDDVRCRRRVPLDYRGCSVRDTVYPCFACFQFLRAPTDFRFP